jgi:hypothetical protein
VRILGRGVTPQVAALARDGIEVLGGIPDIRPHLAAARVVAAPVRYGTGMRGKVLEALAMACAVVTTPIGVEGLGATSGVHLLVANDANGFAHAIASLLDDPRRGRRLGREGRALVTARFDWDVVAAVHEEIYEELLREPGSVPAWRPDPVAAWDARLARLGPGPAIALGFAVLASRGLRWHLGRRWRRRGVAAGPSTRRLAAGGIPAGVSRS